MLHWFFCSGVVSVNRWGFSDPWGVEVYVTVTVCSSNTVSKVRFTGKKTKIVNPREVHEDSSSPTPP